MRALAVGVVFPMVLALACVTGRESRPTRAEAAAGPPARHEETPPKNVPPDQIWVAGYWRWDGVRYVWIPGHLEKRAPGYVRQR